MTQRLRTLLAAAALAALGTGAATTVGLPQSSAAPFPSCYINRDGNCVEEPRAAPTPPPGATYLCNDGTYSFSQHRAGACSHHGGVAKAL
jgi:hypothetical protein